jgi:hypothetical protein
MHRKNLMLLVLLHIISGATAQNSFSDCYKPGDKLYVYSRDGLSFREQADPKGKLILVAAYGDAVEVLDDNLPRVSFTSNNIPGAWAKVRHADKDGYMFNGFLSRLKPMPVTSPDKLIDAFRDYLKNQFKLVNEMKTSPDPIYSQYYKMEFANGVTHEHKIYEGGASIITRFPIQSFTFREAYLLARIAYPEFFGSKKCDYSADHMECELDEYHSLTLKKDADFFILFYSLAD